ncbi:unnamed protein product [Miscanthus lutarioriparius]|uniref:Myb/SANT-like domain-containing protein n=1 Tax=Miscanthus lutarioriparius TaxID=422564 RepID=A0A811PH26_9POAL|nr:unnamed protein product [Miscanthus lutarioriparius]
MRWNNNTSGFVLMRMAHIVSDESRDDKCFKDKDVNHVAKALLEYCGEAVSPSQVYNHLRKWRQKWARVVKLKDLSGALFDHDVNAIKLEPEHYIGHCMDHPKDAEFLNTPIRFYTEMETIFGSSMATGRFALGSSEPLGVNNVDSVAAKIEGHGFTTVVDVKASPEMGEGSKATELLAFTVGVKRKMGNFSEEEMLMMTNMTDAVNNVTSALRETGSAHVDPDLYLAVMEMVGFTTEALIVAYTYLLQNKALGRGFVNMAISHRNIWLRNYLTKNYYM